MSAPALYVVSHEDDDLLFLSPDLYHDIETGRRIVTVFLTAGDAGLDSDYWQSRERGIEAAYALMGGVDDAWTTAAVGPSGLRMRTLQARPDVSVVFLRLPDGFPLGTGSERYGRQSLQRLITGDIAQLDAVDGSASYSHSDLLDTLTALMEEFGPSDIHVQDYVGEFGDGDHSDHHAAAFTAQLAADAYAAPHTLHAHLGYLVTQQDANVEGVDLDIKTAAYGAYAVHDSQLGPTTFLEYLPRQRHTDVAPSPPTDGTENVAAWAFVTASSEDFFSGQTADNLVDDSLQGFPEDVTGEWATVGGRAGSWAELTWSVPVTLSHVVLFDRPNVDDRVTQGTLRFSDGTTVPTGPLDNRGFRTDISFAPRTVTSLRFEVDAVGPATANVGLAEFQVWGVVEVPPDL